MVKRNTNIAKLHSGYLFSEISKRVSLFQKKNPNAKIISLGIGDTTEPIPKYISARLQQSALDLGTIEKYSGYGPEQGCPILRQMIASKLYENIIHPNEIFISDGIKCDLCRLQIPIWPKCIHRCPRSCLSCIC